MESPGDLFRRVIFLLRDGRFNRDMEEELRFHIECREAESRRRGFDPEHARATAIRRVGNPLLWRERSRDAWGWAWLDHVRQDLKLAFRSLTRDPIFCAVVILTLAFGIGMNAAIFSAVHAVLINPYPFPEANRIVAVQEHHISGVNNSSGYQEFLDWQTQSTVFDSMAIVPWSGNYTLTGQGEPVKIIGGGTTAGFWNVLGIHPLLGRFFAQEDDLPNALSVAVITWEMWRSRFNMDSAIVGRSIVLEGRSFSIIGVLPRGFVYPGIQACEFFTPLHASASMGYKQHQYGVIARLKRGVSEEDAQAQMSAIATRIEKLHPETNSGWGVRILPLRNSLAENLRNPILILSCSVGMVLLLACVNISGLLLARASGRLREVGIRAALGACRGRIVRQMLTETVVLGLTGGLAATLLAMWMIRLLRALAPSYLGLDKALQLDSAVLLFMLAVSLVSGIAFGAIPAWLASGADPGAAMKEEGGAWRRARSRNRALSILVTAEVALSVVLLSGAGLMARSFIHGISVETGIRPENVMSFSLGLPEARYSRQQAAMFFQYLLERLNASQQIEAAAAVGTLPLTSGMAGGAFMLDERPKPPNWREHMVQYNASTPGYFGSMGIPILQGRDFNAQDTWKSVPVGIINSTLARQYFPNQNPLGRRYRDDYDGKWRTIVGVAGDVANQQPTREPIPGVYSPHSQSPVSSMWIVLRSRNSAGSVVALARRTVQQLDPDLPLSKMRTMRQVVADALSAPRLLMEVFGTFAIFALLMDAIGLYGIVDYSMRQRRHEIGIRIALGSSRTTIVELIAFQGMVPALIGVAIGLGAAASLSGVFRTVLFGVPPRDAAVGLAVSVVLLAVIAGATFFPSRRALRVDPAEVLRYE